MLICSSVFISLHSLRNFSAFVSSHIPITPQKPSPPQGDVTFMNFYPGIGLKMNFAIFKVGKMV